MSKLKDLVPGIKEDNIPKKGTNVDELEMGIKVEMEHVATFKKIEEYYMKNKEMPSEKQMAEWVTRDHLKEFNDYYTRLKKMEGSQGLKESQVGDLYIQIGEAIEKMESNPEKYKAMNPPNGWGNYEGALEVLKEMAKVAFEYPETVFLIT